MGNTNVSTANYATNGYIRITWDNSDESPGWEAWRVYRRDNDAGTGWVLLYQVTTSSASYTYDDYTAPANRSLDYAVVEVTSGNVEGTYTPINVTVSAEAYYWLIDHEDSSLSFRREHVRGDSFDDEYEEATMELIGRGRKRDVGTRWGVSGTLEAQIKAKNGKTTLEQYAEIKALKESQHEVSLRTPFGDVYKVALGKISYDRIPGVGTDNQMDVSIEYEEIA